MKLWKISSKSLSDRCVEPREVDAVDPRWPNKDSDGETIYDNTHFGDREKAWKALLSNIEAGVWLAGRKVVTARAQMREAEVASADATELYVRAGQGYIDWTKAVEGAAAAQAG